FAILIACTDEDADPPQARNSAFMVDLPAEGWEIVRDIDTMAGRGNHCEIRISDLHVADDKMLGGRGEGHLLGQYRLGPARLGYSTDTPLERMMRHARSARLVDGADEVHLQTIARNMIATYKEHGSTKLATGDLL